MNLFLFVEQGRFLETKYFKYENHKKIGYCYR